MGNSDLKIEKEIEQTDINSLRTDMISINAHQIRTSLSSIKWIIEMFLNEDVGKLSTEQENLMRKAKESNDRALEIVSELLMANKTTDITEKKYCFSEVNISEVIESSIFDFTGEAHARGIEIIFLKQASALPNVRADKEKLRVVIENLLENAIKYSNMHGKIFIATKEESGFVEISVKDTGIGISEEGKGKIFDKFYRDENAQKKEPVGSGIGLFTARKIIENHGGKVWFESKKDEGTTLFLTLPVST
ncbi:MAG: HAMP domain-containing sensor histidine kinase [Candidatus Paceibacterota bacterium]